jgi:CHASE2 domain-containing sensor protein
MAETTDQIIGRILQERAAADGMQSAHDFALLILAGVVNFIVCTRGDNVARTAVSEIAAGLELALAFKSIELTGARQ